MSLAKLFSIFYHGRIRQESDFTWYLQMLHLKHFSMEGTVYECTAEEFNKLVNLCRQIEKQNPKALNLDAGISYNDDLNKKIGKHAFVYEFPLSDQQINEFVAKYYPHE